MMVDHSSTRPRSLYHHHPSKGLFTMATGFPIRKLRAKTVTSGNIHYSKDMKDTIHQANIINIVAAVNDSGRVTRREHSDNISDKSTKTVIDFSNVMFPREHSAAVISQQRVFEMPSDAIQKKPVYYKHSGDQEVNTAAHMRVYDERHMHIIRRKKVKPPERSKTSIAKIVKNLPMKPQIEDSSFLGTHLNVTSESHRKKSASSQSRYSAMSVRQLGSLKKSSEPRVVHDIAKCDMIDLLDHAMKNDINGIDNATCDNKTEANQQPQSAQLPVPYLRTKSLPIIFPAKNSKATNMKQESVPKGKVPHVFKDRPLSQTMRKSFPVSLYRTMLSQPSGSNLIAFAINNGFNDPLELSTLIVNDSQIQQDCNQIPKLHQRVTAGIYHMNRSKLRKPLTPNVGRAPMHVHHPSMKLLNGNDRSSQLVHDRYTLQRSKTEHNEDVRRVMSGKQEDNPSHVNSAKSKESHRSFRPDGNTVDHDDKVSSTGQTNGDDVDTSLDTTHESLNEKDIPDEQGGLCIIQSSKSASKAFIQDVRPMSAKELLRIQKRILPANQIAQNHNIVQFTPENSGIIIRKVQLSNSSLSSMSSIEKHDNDGGTFDEQSNDPLLSIGKYEERLANMKGDVCNTVVLDTISTTENYARNIEEGKVALMNEQEQIEYYKIVKAVDLNTYEGYEHKKMRSSAGSNRKEGDPKSKVHYVKVRLS
ncbi:uncharacterized protein LOC127863128 [Dreissena polymorpha]|uniref:Uncharacterized protein n=1 Tax=Dreissena polymorpha TaxID=45954 RepID=A0A9D3Y4X7_DREPO|nr:uncharacterized protein LOC127863128 [Dreissena polymorpha]KAH3693157.1 hypothetical protein DPMN_192559 [Dreissena polymorpha]